MDKNIEVASLSRSERTLRRAETNEKNWRFIEKYSGRTFQSFEEAQNFMLQDAQTRNNTIRSKKCDEPISQEEIDAIHNSTKFSCELDTILERVDNDR